MLNLPEEVMAKLIRAFSKVEKPSKKQVYAMVKEIEKLSFLEFMVLAKAFEIVSKKVQKVNG